MREDELATSFISLINTRLQSGVDKTKPKNANRFSGFRGFH